MDGSVIHVTDDNFDETVLKSEMPVLLDFSAEWCAPCKMLAPILKDLAAEYQDRMIVAHGDTDDCPRAATGYRITAVPTLIIFKNGEEVERLIGLRSKQALESAIDAII